MLCSVPMGTDFRSLALFGAALEDVRNVVLEWMGKRGFELDDRPWLPCEGNDERGAFLLESEGRVVVCFSERDEERRLVVELGALRVPILGVVCHDSDIWGYTLVVDGEIRGAFFTKNSGFAPSNYFDDPADEAIYAGAPEVVAREVGLPDRAARIARLQKKWSLFRESVAREFCEALEIEAAATDYQYLEAGEDVPERWRVVELRFRRPSPRAAFDLHSDGLWRAPPPQDRQAHIDAPKFEAPLSWRVLGWLISFLMRPLLFIGLRLLRRRIDANPEAFRQVGPRGPCPYRVDGAHVVNDTQRIRVRLPDGGRAAEWTRLAGQPWAALAVDIGDHLICFTPWREESVRNAGRREEFTDEKFSVGELRARRLVRSRTRETRDGPRTRVEESYFVQTSSAVYRVACTRGTDDSVPSAALRALVESFEERA